MLITCFNRRKWPSFMTLFMMVSGNSCWGAVNHFWGVLQNECVLCHKEAERFTAFLTQSLFHSHTAHNHLWTLLHSLKVLTHVITQQKEVTRWPEFPWSFFSQHPWKAQTETQSQTEAQSKPSLYTQYMKKL